MNDVRTGEWRSSCEVISGNRLSEVVTKPTTTNSVTYGYSGNDQLTNEVSTLNGPTKYLYDANGSLTSKTNATANTGYAFSYDLQNRLQGASVTGLGGGPITTSYLYNDQGIRVRTIANSTAKYYLNDLKNPTGYSQVLEELGTVGGTPTMSYVLGDDVLAQAPSSGTAAYLRHDGHGSTRQLSQTGNVVVEQYNYDAYGQSLGTQPTYASPPATMMLYADQQFDPALQHYYLRARYYDASNGRFNQLDPLTGNSEDPQSLHKYQYADADPVNGVDPGGQQTLVELLVAVTVVATLSGLVGGAVSASTGGSFAEGFASSFISSALATVFFTFFPEIPPNIVLAVAATISRLLIELYVYDWSNPSLSEVRIFIAFLGALTFGAILSKIQPLSADIPAIQKLIDEFGVREAVRVVSTELAKTAIKGASMGAVLGAANAVVRFSVALAQGAQRVLRKYLEPIKNEVSDALGGSLPMGQQLTEDDLT